MNKKVKKFFSGFVVVFMYFLLVNKVSAATLSIEDVSKQFNETPEIKELSGLFGTITSKVNFDEKTLDIYSKSEKIFVFKYTDEYIEYDNRNFVVTPENCMDGMFDILWVGGVMESVFILSGYENKGLVENVKYNNTYDEYGLQLDVENYNFSGEDENGGSWSSSGEHLKYFKISLDTEKIDALITEYGVDVDDEDEDANKEVIANLTPTLEVKDITENSVTIYPKVNYNNTDSDYSVTCYIYRSDSENGSYEKISEFAVNCTDSIGIVDDGLKSNTTYYYKAIVSGGTNYSDALSVTTKGSSTIISDDTNEDNTQDNIAENPKTGVVIKYGILFLMVLIGGFTYLLIRKRSKFPKHN